MRPQCKTKEGECTWRILHEFMSTCLHSQNTDHHGRKTESGNILIKKWKMKIAP